MPRVAYGLMSEVHSFNRDYDREGVNKLKEGMQRILKFCERGLKCHWNVLGNGGCFFVLIDKKSREWYSDKENWSHVSHGTIMLLNLFKINCDIIYQVLKAMIIVDGEGYDRDFSYWDEDGITKCETFEEYLRKYGCSLFNHKFNQQPKKKITQIFETIMKEYAGRTWIKYDWDFRFFSNSRPKDDHWEKFVAWASIANEPIRNLTHVFHPMVRFSRRILFVEGKSKLTRLKKRDIKISYKSQQAYNESLDFAVAHVHKIGILQDKGISTKSIKKQNLSSLLSSLEEDELQSLPSSSSKKKKRKKKISGKQRRNKAKIRNKIQEINENDSLSDEERKEIEILSVQQHQSSSLSKKKKAKIRFSRKGRRNKSDMRSNKEKDIRIGQMPEETGDGGISEDIQEDDSLSEEQIEEDEKQSLDDYKLDSNDICNNDEEIGLNEGLIVYNNTPVNDVGLMALSEGNNNLLTAQSNNNKNRNYNGNSTRRAQKRTISEMDDDVTVLSPISFPSNGKFARVMFNGNKRRKLKYSGQSLYSQLQMSQCYIKHTFYNPRSPQERKVSPTSSVCSTRILIKILKLRFFNDLTFFFFFCCCIHRQTILMEMH